MEKIDFNSIAHEIWATAQLLPSEGIVDGVSRIENILYDNFDERSNKVDTPNVCIHEFETMSGKIKFVEKCSICGEKRR